MNSWDSGSLGFSELFKQKFMNGLQTVTAER